MHAELDQGADTAAVETRSATSTSKFERRFRGIELLVRERGIGADLDALEALWQEVKRR